MFFYFLHFNYRNIKVFFLKFERELLFGRWFREEIDEPNKKIIEYAQLSVDGSFEFTFVTLQVTVGEVDQVVEQGNSLSVGYIHIDCI